jgi:transposase-like protein
MPYVKPFSKEFKDQVCGRIKNDGIAVSQAAADHGLSSKTIYRWLREDVSSSVSYLEHARLKRENKALLELIGRLTLEKEKSFKKG